MPTAVPMRERQFNERPENSLPQLKKKSARGALFTLMGTGSAFLLNLVSTAILARLLIPEDFGLIAMVTAITGLLLVFGDIGLAMATIQRESISHDQVSSLFWVNVGLGLALTLLVAACSPLFAWIYQESRLPPPFYSRAWGYNTKHYSSARCGLDFYKRSRYAHKSSASVLRFFSPRMVETTGHLYPKFLHQLQSSSFCRG